MLRTVLALLIFGFLLFYSTSGFAQAKIELATYRAEQTHGFNYFLYYPPDYTDTGSEKFPLLLFLHGGGESGLDLQAISKFGPPSLLTEGHSIPMLVLAPQHPHARQLWDVTALKRLLDYIVQTKRVDKNRIYLTGLSRGGFGCWELAINYPDTFAAMAVVCGMSPAPYASWLEKEMGIWLFHGTEDRVIPFQESRKMADRLRELKHNFTFTTYQGLGHEIWERAYRTPGLFDWFLAHQLR